MRVEVHSHALTLCDVATVQNYLNVTAGRALLFYESVKSTTSRLFRTASGGVSLTVRQRTDLAIMVDIAVRRRAG